MNIEIRKLSKDLLDDWLNYFDNIAFSDGNEWAGCYCMHYHWSQEMEDAWKATGQSNGRERAISLINDGILQGYVAYMDGNAAGWCNANDKQAYDTVLYEFPWEETEREKKIKAVVCFNTAPSYRNMGIATKLLERVCSDAAADGYEYVEAYPFSAGENKDYHGPLSIYEKTGFQVHGKHAHCTIVRKYL